jgi:Holliday junction resolvase RusA-like endonuclease
MTPLAFTVHGTPVPQGSMRTLGKGRPTIADNRGKLEPWRAAVASAAAEATNGAGPLTGAVRLDVTFVFPRPKAHYRTGKYAGQLKSSAPNRCATKPDVDKLLRAIGDALTGIAFVDDAQIVEIVARKHYGIPAAHVELEELPA